MAKHRRNTAKKQTHQTTLIEVTETHIIGSKVFIRVDTFHPTIARENTSIINAV